jgi:hypothetical protein
LKIGSAAWQPERVTFENRRQRERGYQDEEQHELACGHDVHEVCAFSSVCAPLQLPSQQHHVRLVPEQVLGESTDRTVQEGREMKTKKFGRHVVAFDGRMNDKPVREYVGCTFNHISLDSPQDSEWLSTSQAKKLGQDLIKAAEYIEAHKKKRKEKEHER